MEKKGTTVQGELKKYYPGQYLHIILETQDQDRVSVKSSKELWGRNEMTEFKTSLLQCSVGTQLQITNVSDYKIDNMTGQKLVWINNQSKLILKNEKKREVKRNEKDFMNEKRIYNEEEKTQTNKQYNDLDTLKTAYQKGVILAVRAKLRTTWYTYSFEIQNKKNIMIKFKEMVIIGSLLFSTTLISEKELKFLGEANKNFEYETKLILRLGKQLPLTKNLQNIVQSRITKIYLSDNDCIFAIYFHIYSIVPTYQLNNKPAVYYNNCKWPVKLTNYNSSEPLLSFDYQGKIMTIKQYFKEVKGIELDDKKALFETQTKGKNAKTIYLPSQLCTIAEPIKMQSKRIPFYNKEIDKTMDELQKKMIISQIDFSESTLPKCEILNNKEIPKVVLLNLTGQIFDHSQVLNSTNKSVENKQQLEYEIQKLDQNDIKGVLIILNERLSQSEYIDIKIQGDKKGVATQIFIADQKNTAQTWKAVQQQLYDKIYPKKIPKFIKKGIIIGMDAAKSLASFNCQMVKEGNCHQFNYILDISQEEEVRSNMEYLNKEQLENVLNKVIDKFREFYNDLPEIIQYVRDGGNIQNFKEELQYINVFCEKKKIKVRAMMQIKRTRLIGLQGEIMIPAGQMRYIQQKEYYVIIGSLCARGNNISKPLLIYAFKQNATFEDIMMFISFTCSSHWYFSSIKISESVRRADENVYMYNLMRQKIPIKDLALFKGSNIQYF